MPSLLRSEARATALWLAVAVPGRMRSSVVFGGAAVAEACDRDGCARTDVLRIGAEDVQVHPQRREIGSLEQRVAFAGDPAERLALRASTTPSIGVDTL